MSARNKRAAKTARRKARQVPRRARPADGFSDYDLADFDLPVAAAAELDELAASGQLPAGFTLGMGGVEGEVPPGMAQMARSAFPGGWEPGWSWRCGMAACSGGHALGSPALIRAIGVCTGS
jgi:hypothetical protein